MVRSVFFIQFLYLYQKEALGDWHLVRRSPNKRACTHVRRSCSKQLHLPFEL